MKEWKSRKQTKWVRASLEEEIEEIKNEWACGDFSRQSAEETAQKSAEAIGRIVGLSFALDFLVQTESTVEEVEEDER